MLITLIALTRRSAFSTLSRSFSVSVWTIISGQFLVPVACTLTLFIYSIYISVVTALATCTQCAMLDLTLFIDLPQEGRGKILVLEIVWRSKFGRVAILEMSLALYVARQF